MTSRKRVNLLFELWYIAGDTTWLWLYEISNLEALNQNQKPARHGGHNGSSVTALIFEQFKANTIESIYNHSHTAHVTWKANQPPEHTMAWWDQLNKVPKCFGNQGFDYQNKCHHQPCPTCNQNYDIISDLVLHTVHHFV